MQDWFRIMAFKPELVIDTIGPEENNQIVSYMEHRHDQAILTGLLLTCSCANVFLQKRLLGLRRAILVRLLLRCDVEMSQNFRAKHVLLSLLKS